MLIYTPAQGYGMLDNSIDPIRARARGDWSKVLGLKSGTDAWMGSKHIEGPHDYMWFFGGAYRISDLKRFASMGHGVDIVERSGFKYKGLPCMTVGIRPGKAVDGFRDLTK